MYLVEDNRIRPPVTDAPAKLLLRARDETLCALDSSPGGKWQHFPNSSISHHGTACCEVAKQWLTAFDFAQLNGADPLSGPRWIRQHSSWGPSPWPIHWCEAVDRKVLDCGAHAAMAHEVFLARGLKAFRAQFVQQYSAEAATSWRANWQKKSASDHWIDRHAIYHEGNAVLIGEDEVKLWDGSAGWWMNPRQQAGYGSLTAVRIAASLGSYPRDLRWGDRKLPVGRWTEV